MSRCLFPRLPAAARFGQSDTGDLRLRVIDPSRLPVEGTHVAACRPTAPPSDSPRHDSGVLDVFLFRPASLDRRWNFTLPLGGADATGSSRALALEMSAFGRRFP